MAARRRSSSARARRPRRRRAGARNVLIVNMIPKSLSGEEHQDSEPTIAVNPANSRQIVGSAFTPDPAEGPNAPIYVSLDGGLTWTLNSIVPSTVADGSATADITVAFGSASNVLYAGIIRYPFPGDRTRLNVLRTTDVQSAEIMQVLVDRIGRGVDQPYVQADTIRRGAGKGKDRVYVGSNDFNAVAGNTATIDRSLDGGGARPAFKAVRIESRATAGQDGPTVRPAVHADGTVYAVFHAWRTFDDHTGAGTADIVVVRDDAAATGARPFTSLVDPGDGKAGIRVVQGARFNFNGYLGLQRTGGDVSIAVDPRDSDVVYVAYNADEDSVYALHVLRSTDRGRTWSRDLHHLRDALNPALAINTAGTVGLLYQQLRGAGAAQQWVTRVETTTNGTMWSALTLARTPAQIPRRQFDPYLGDYDRLMAVGKDFYGVFSASNVPRKANFPNGVVYQRNANFTTSTLLDVDGTTPVHPSIDPFFFKIAG